MASSEVVEAEDRTGPLTRNQVRDRVNKIVDLLIEAEVDPEVLVEAKALAWEAYTT